MSSDQMQNQIQNQYQKNLDDQNEQLDINQES